MCVFGNFLNETNLNSRIRNSPWIVSSYPNAGSVRVPCEENMGVAPSVPLCRTKEEPLFSSAHVTVTESIPRWTIERRCPAALPQHPPARRHRQLYKCYGLEPSPRQGTSVSILQILCSFTQPQCQSANSWGPRFCIWFGLCSVLQYNPNLPIVRSSLACMSMECSQ